MLRRRRSTSCAVRVEENPAVGSHGIRRSRSQHRDMSGRCGCDACRRSDALVRVRFEMFSRAGGAHAPVDRSRVRCAGDDRSRCGLRSFAGLNVIRVYTKAPWKAGRSGKPFSAPVGGERLRTWRRWSIGIWRHADACAGLERERRRRSHRWKGHTGCPIGTSWSSMPESIAGSRWGGRFLERSVLNRLKQIAAQVGHAGCSGVVCSAASAGEGIPAEASARLVVDFSVKIDPATFARIPSLPAVAVKLLQHYANPDISLAAVAEILRPDPALTTRPPKAAAVHRSSGLASL